MVAFVTSTLIAILATGGIVAYSKRRPADADLTWGEAMMGSFIVFFLMFWVYGIVPHQFLSWADNELNWRTDKIFVGPGGILRSQQDGGWSPIRLTYVVIRDLLAVGIYVIALGGNIVLWSIWQKRGQTQTTEKAPQRSAFGRPLIKQGAES